MKKLPTVGLAILLATVFFGMRAIKSLRNKIEELSLEHRYADAASASGLGTPSGKDELSPRNQTTDTRQRPTTSSATGDVTKRTVYKPITEQERTKQLQAALSTSAIVNCLSQDVDIRYGLLYPQLSLDPDKLSKFRMLLAQQLMSVGRTGTVLGLSPQDVERQIKDLIGDFEYNKYQNYQQDVPKLAPIARLQSILAGQDIPLTQEQLAEVGNALKTTSNNALPLSDVSTKRNEVLNEAAIEQASKTLSQAQMKILRNLAAQQRAELDLANLTTGLQNTPLSAR